MPCLSGVGRSRIILADLGEEDGKTFGLPIVHSTVKVASGRGKPTVPELAGLLEDSPPIDRTSINSWEDADFVAAVRATGRRKLIFCALWHSRGRHDDRNHWR